MNKVEDSYLEDEGIDALIAKLPRPQPPDSLRTDFYKTLEQESTCPIFMQFATGTAVLALLFLSLVLFFSLRSSLQTTTAGSIPVPETTDIPPTQRASFTPSPLAFGPEAAFNQLKLKLAFSDSAPPDPTEVLPFMREDFLAYIRGLPEGFTTLENGAELFRLHETLSPYAPYGLVMKLEDVDNDGQRELLVGILPPVLLIEPNATGEVQITELPWPEKLPAIGSAPTRIDTGDFDENGRPDIRIVYSHVDYPERENETITVTYDGVEWTK